MTCGVESQGGRCGRHRNARSDEAIQAAYPGHDKIGRR